MSDSSKDAEYAAPRWEGLLLIPTKHAMLRARQLRMDMFDVAAILEAGVDCETGPRRPGIRERCANWRGELTRVIVSRGPSGWVDGEEAWIILNIKPVGKT